jgi:hypothetical protein
MIIFLNYALSHVVVAAEVEVEVEVVKIENGEVVAAQ